MKETVVSQVIVYNKNVKVFLPYFRAFAPAPDERQFIDIIMLEQLSQFWI